jgi:hypothetical protein
MCIIIIIIIIIIITIENTKFSVQRYLIGLAVDTESVYCAVGTESLNMIQVSLGLHGINKTHTAYVCLTFF